MRKYQKNETWVDVPGYEGYYQVSNFGKVKSASRMVKYRHGLRFSKGRTLKCKTGKDGYILCDFSRDGVVKTFRLHRIVMISFVGESPDGYLVLHCNGNKTDNNITNLRYGTHKDNSNDMKLHGTINAGERNGMSRLNSKDINKIRLLSKTLTRKNIADIYKCHKGTIGQIIRKERWAHV